MTSSPVTRERMLHLDALRAFAVGAVMVEHYSGASDLIPIGAGMLGVSLFFVLSGFLITSLLMAARHSELSRTRALAGFYVRRLFRLLPAFYLVLATVTLLGLGDLRTSWPWHAAYLSNVYAALGGQSNVFWTLAVEEQFYLLWPLLLFILPNGYVQRTGIVLIVGCLILKCALVGINVDPDHRLLPFQLTMLGGGCVLAAKSFDQGKPFQMHWFDQRASRVLGTLGIVGLGIAAAVWDMFGTGLYRTLFNDLLCLPALAWLVASAAKGYSVRPIKAVFDNRALQYIGKISYGLYLVHNWVPKALDKFFVLDGLPKLTATLVLTFAICAFSWRFIELPAIRAGQRLSSRAEARSGPLKAQTTVA